MEELYDDIVPKIHDLAPAVVLPLHRLDGNLKQQQRSYHQKIISILSFLPPPGPPLAPGRAGGGF